MPFARSAGGVAIALAATLAASAGRAADLGPGPEPSYDPALVAPPSVMFAPISTFPWRPVQTHIVAQPVSTEVVYPDRSPADQAPVIIMVVPPEH